jgi:hypothetical protein
VVGTFAGLPEGARLTVQGQNFQISYRGGDGNDVVLTPLLPISFRFDRAFQLGERRTRGDVTGDKVPDLVFCSPGSTVTAFRTPVKPTRARYVPGWTLPHRLQ